MKVLRLRWGGRVPYVGYLGISGPKGYGYFAVLVRNRVSFSPFWSQIRCRFCSLVLKWACFVEEAVSPSKSIKTLPLTVVWTEELIVRQQIWNRVRVGLFKSRLSKPRISENFNFSFLTFGWGQSCLYCFFPSGLSLENVKLRKT